MSSKLKSLRYRVKEVVPTSDCQVLSPLLVTYATDDIIAAMDREISCFAKRSTMSVLKFANALGLKMVTCLHVYDEYVINGILVEGLLQAFRPQYVSLCE